MFVLSLGKQEIKFEFLNCFETKKHPQKQHLSRIRFFWEMPKKNTKQKKASSVFIFFEESKPVDRPMQPSSNSFIQLWIHPIYFLKVKTRLWGWGEGGAV